MLDFSDLRVQAALAAVSCIAANYIDIVGVTGSIPVSPTTLKGLISLDILACLVDVALK